MGYKDEDLITLTHVCRAWREIFISHSFLWTNFDCRNADKTRVYLERSKSSPINLQLSRTNAISPGDPLLQIIPRSTSRLRSLSITGTRKNLHGITSRLSRHAPLLERLDINGSYQSRPQRNPILTTALFNGDLSSLRELRLQSVHTELPWRNMANLTSFTLCHTSSGNLSIKQLLDFFRSAPRLRNIKLDSATPTSGGRDGGLVFLAYLERMDILQGGPSSLLLDHLVIPAGVKFTEWVPSFGPEFKTYLPRSLDNFGNVADFTKIHIRFCGHHRHMQLSGPNGRFSMVSPFTSHHLALGCVVWFDVSKAERLVVDSIYGYAVLSPEGLHHLKNLRTITFSQHTDPRRSIANLHPSEGLFGVVPCPKLEELVFASLDNTEGFDIGSVTRIVAARALRGAKLGTIRIVGGPSRFKPKDLLELRKYVSHLEYDPEVDVADGDGEDSDREC